MSFLLPFGEAPDGRLVTVNDVDRGRSCNCLCPGCKEPLVARKGDVMSHHFVHDTFLSCVGAYETMLHKLGKQVISECKEFWIPPVMAVYRGNRVLARPAERFRPSSVRQETVIGAIRPDLIAALRDREMIVEIRVSHKVGNEKKESLIGVGLEAIEIDLSGYSRDAAPQDLVYGILQGAPRYWLFCPYAADVQEAYARDRRVAGAA